jgi:hypothetical protein
MKNQASQWLEKAPPAYPILPPGASPYVASSRQTMRTCCPPPTQADQDMACSSFSLGRGQGGDRALDKIPQCPLLWKAQNLSALRANMISSQHSAAQESVMASYCPSKQA